MMIEKQFEKHFCIVYDKTKPQDTLQICRGAKVMLTSNLSVALGLTNGILGSVIGVKFVDNSLPKVSEVGPEKVHYILVNFPTFKGGMQLESYGGPPLPPGETYAFENFTDYGVPIFIQSKPVYSTTHERYVQEYRFPLRLGYAVTVHKVQSQTLDMVTIHLSHSEQFAASDYVSFSRTRSFANLMINDSIIPDERFTRKDLMGTRAYKSNVAIQDREGKRLTLHQIKI